MSGDGTEYMPNCRALTGYKVKLRQREPFVVRGYTILVPPGLTGKVTVADFWQDVRADGRLERLVRASTVQPWVLGVSSWDPMCDAQSRRYTVGIEENENTDFSPIESGFPLFSQTIVASDWNCFELTRQQLDETFWMDNPYAMVRKLGYESNPGEPRRIIQVDALPPLYDPQKNATMEFWITATKR